MLRSVVAFRVGGLLRREMLIFATPPVCIARISSCHEITQFKPLSVTTILNLKARYDVTMSIGPPRMREIHTRVHPKSIFACCNCMFSPTLKLLRWFEYLEAFEIVKMVVVGEDGGADFLGAGSDEDVL
jgi:hypothetical protein